jgi:hypothetical protein
MTRVRRIAAALIAGSALTAVGIGTANADYCGDALCLYENSGVSGPVAGFNVADSNFNNGNHFSDGVNLNDNISSIDSWTSSSARFYTNSLFRGNTQDVSGLATINQVTYNDQYSSFRYLV